MRRFALILSLALALAALAATGASAEGNPHFTFTIIEQPVTLPAGTLCDFNYGESATGTGTGVFLDDGSQIAVHATINVTHVNEDTGYTLTETDQISGNFNLLANHSISVGLMWALRDASGKLVLIKAGEITFDAFTGEVLKFTPNTNPDFAAVVCPALGGSPA
jgi:type 1 fimbria pilin